MPVRQWSEAQEVLLERTINARSNKDSGPVSMKPLGCSRRRTSTLGSSFEGGTEASRKACRVVRKLQSPTSPFASRLPYCG